LLAQAGDDYTKLLAATDAWFNAEMDRVSGWYARQTQWIVIGIALFVVSFSGVDTLEMVRTLSLTNPATLSAIGDNVLKQACANNAPSTLDNVCHPTTNARNPQQAPTQTTPDITSQPATNGPSSGSAFDVTQFLHTRGDPLSNWGQETATQSGLHYWRWPGMLLTWLALALGGPFWFNMLCSIANVRSAGRKPQSNGHATTQGT